MASLKARALRLLAQREHSRAELQRKLLAKSRQAALGAAVSGADAQDRPGDGLADGGSSVDEMLVDIERTLDELQRHGLLSDERTAEAVLLAKAPRYGSRRIKQWLQARSLDAALVSDTLARARDTEFERAHDVWQRRFGQAPADLRERARQQRFLAGRGFEAPVIERVLKAAKATLPAGPAPVDQDD